MPKKIGTLQRHPPQPSGLTPLHIPSNDNPAPVFFFQHVEGVKEGHEEIEKFLRLSNNAEWETDIDRRLAALQDAVACAERIKSDPNAAKALEGSIGILYGNLAGTILNRRTHSYVRNKEDALRYFALAISHFEREGNIGDAAKTHYNIATSLFQGMSSDDFADIPLCLSHLREALRLYQLTEAGWIPPEVRLNFAACAIRSQGFRRTEDIAEAIRLLGTPHDPIVAVSIPRIVGFGTNHISNSSLCY